MACKSNRKEVIKMSTYFRAKRDDYDPFTDNSLVKGELLTPRERYTQARNFQDDAFEIVEISRKKTFIFFGARLEKREDEINASN